MGIFQKKVQELLPIKLNIKMKERKSLELKPNSFNEVLPYLKPNKFQFQRSEVYENFSLGICPNSLFDIWFFLRSFGRIGFEKSTFLRLPPRERYTVYQKQLSPRAASDTAYVSWEWSIIACINRRRQIFTKKQLRKNYWKYIAVIFCH